MLKAQEKTELRRLVHHNESWFALEFYYLTKWTAWRENVTQNVRQKIAMQESMLTIV
jgi:hypothetical protein